MWVLKSRSLAEKSSSILTRDNLAGHEITYIDENDGTHIGENDEDGIELITSEECEPPTKTRVLDASSQNITFQTGRSL